MVLRERYGCLRYSGLNTSKATPDRGGKSASTRKRSEVLSSEKVVVAN